MLPEKIGRLTGASKVVILELVRSKFYNGVCYSLIKANIKFLDFV